MHDVADFRSDKVAQPTREMIEAMARCEWGDGVGDEGPTVRRLEALAAKLTGKEAAMVCATGTLANQIAIHTHTRPGDAVVIDEAAHIFWTEGGIAPTVSGVQMHAVPSERGIVSVDAIRRVFARLDMGARPALVCTENTHNFGGGRVVPLDLLGDIRAVASKHGAAVHLDGARIFNASVKSGIPAAKYAATADSVMFCLSKGLCAPAGSMLCGTREFIARARRFRERIGSFIKQPAPLAAAGIVALTTMIDRLHEDHANAARLGRGLKGVTQARRLISVEPVETNMVFVRLLAADGDGAVSALDRKGVRTYHLGGGRLRFAVHRDVDAEDVDRTVEVIGAFLRRKGRA